MCDAHDAAGGHLPRRDRSTRPRLVGILSGALLLGTALSGCSLPFTGGGGGGSGSGSASALKEIGSWHGTYTDATVVVGGDDATKVVRSISVDGRTFVLDPDGAGVSRLQPGSTMLLARMAIRKVVDVQRTDRGAVVTTESAGIADLVKDGGFDYATDVDMAGGASAAFVSAEDCPGRYGLPGTGDKAAQLTACGLPAPAAAPDDSSSTTSTSSSSSDSSGSSSDPGAAPTSSATSSDSTTSSSDAAATASGDPTPVAMAPANHFLGSEVRTASFGSGKFGPWDWTAGFTPQSGGVGLNLSVTGAEGTGKASLTGSGFVSNFGITGQVTVRGCKPAFTVRASGLHGSVDLKWTAANEKGVFASLRKWHPNVAFYIPIGRVGPIPLVIRIGAGVLLAPALVGTGGGEGSYHVDFAGDLAFDVSGGAVAVHSGLKLEPRGDAPAIKTLGPSGFIGALQYPQISLVLGTPASQLPLAFADVVLSGGSVYSGGLNGLKQCTGLTLDATNSAGFMPVTAGLPVSAGKTALTDATKTATAPEGAAC